MNVLRFGSLVALLDSVRDSLDPDDTIELVEALDWEPLVMLWERPWFRELLLEACEARAASGLEVLDAKTEVEGRRRVLSVGR